jgi:hypothetical protein
VVCRLCH